MCRALMYLGQPIHVDDLLFKTDSSLIKQTYQPKLMEEFNNLAGFGLVAWSYDSNSAEIPYIYRTTALPFFDRNLKNLVTKLHADCLIAHVRGAPYSDKSIIDNRNLHPFKFENCPFLLAHNGNLYNFKQMRYELIKYMNPDIAMDIEGTTDSECVYALILSQLTKPFAEVSINDCVSAILKSIDIIRTVRAKMNIDQASPLNLFISNGHFIIATRFVFDFSHFTTKHDLNNDDLAYQSLWYTIGKEYGFHAGEYQMLDGVPQKSIIVSSEPLTEDVTTWLEVPEYSILTAERKEGQIHVEIIDI